MIDRALVARSRMPVNIFAAIRERPVRATLSRQELKGVFVTASIAGSSIKIA
jgi:hypothetical protein